MWKREQSQFAWTFIRYHKWCCKTFKCRRNVQSGVNVTVLHRGDDCPWLSISCRGQSESWILSPLVTEQQALFSSLDYWHYSLLPSGTAFFPLTSQAVLPISCFASMIPLDPLLLLKWVQSAPLGQKCKALLYEEAIGQFRLELNGFTPSAKGSLKFSNAWSLTGESK